MEYEICYECLICKTQWGLGPSENISHGLCNRCIRELYADKIRAEQLKYSGIACFLTGHEDCREFSCRYRSACLDSEYKRWKETIIEGNKN